MHATKRSFVPAAGIDLALPLYDPLTRWFGADRLRRELVERAGLRAGLRVLDVGCGTGTLAVYAKQLCPAAIVTGIDPDPRALARARRKAALGRVEVRFDEGFGDALPYPNASFDHVFSSFMLHHLEAPARRRLLEHVRRVLSPGGTLHLIDFARSNDSGSDLRAIGFARVSAQDAGRVMFQRIAGYSASVDG